ASFRKWHGLYSYRVNEGGIVGSEGGRPGRCHRHKSDLEAENAYRQVCIAAPGRWPDFYGCGGKFCHLRRCGHGSGCLGRAHRRQIRRFTHLRRRTDLLLQPGWHDDGAETGKEVGSLGNEQVGEWFHGFPRSRWEG